MTEEQRLQAEQLVRNAKVNEIAKKYTLYLHKDCMELVEVYGLPFRIIFDHEKNAYEKGYAKFSEVYPLPGYPIEGRYTFNYPTDYLDPEPHYYGATENKLKAEQKQALDNWISKYEHELTDYYLLHLLDNYDLDTFTVFDFYGDTRDIQPGELEVLRKYYKRRQKEFRDNPNKYLEDEPIYTDEDRKRYSPYKYLVTYPMELVEQYNEDNLQQAREREKQGHRGYYFTTYETVLAEGHYLDREV